MANDCLKKQGTAMPTLLLCLELSGLGSKSVFSLLICETTYNRVLLELSEDT